MKHSKLLRTLLSIIIIGCLVFPTQFAMAATTARNWETKASLLKATCDPKCVTLNGKIYIIGGMDNIIQNSPQMYDTVEQYDPSQDKWTYAASLHIKRSEFNVEIIDGKIYVIGGANSQGALASVEEYDPIKNTWNDKAPMHTARMLFSSVVIDGKIYVMGGVTSANCIGNPLDSVEVYDPKTDKWDIKASMKTARKDFSAQVINNRIYAFGGIVTQAYSGSGATSNTEEYDVATDTWTSKKPMPIATRSYTSIQLSGKIYVFGGESPSGFLSSVEVYDPQSDTWGNKPSMPNVTGSPSLLLNSNSAYITSGWPAETIFKKYDFQTDQWTDEAALPAQVAGATLVRVNDRIYAIGGYSGNNAVPSVYAYPIDSSPMLTVTASLNKVRVGQQFTADIAIHNVTNICAEDIKLTYDKDLFEYEGATGQTGTKIYKEDTSTPGMIRFITACQGKENAATGDKGLITLKFKAKAKGVGKVDIIKGHIADNATLEEDVTDENCGEDTITVDGCSDVNRSGSWTLLDLGIDAYYDGINASDTDSTKYDADVIPDSKIDDNDLTQITQEILANKDYAPNN